LSRSHFIRFTPQFLNGTLKFWFSFGQYSTSFESVLRSAEVAQEDYSSLRPARLHLWVPSLPPIFYFTHSLSSAIQGSQPVLQASQTYVNSLRTPFCHLTAFFAAFYPRARPRVTLELSTYMRIRLIGSNYACLHSR
jgi:hypothetical protein